MTEGDMRRLRANIARATTLARRDNGAATQAVLAAAREDYAYAKTLRTVQQLDLTPVAKMRVVQRLQADLAAVDATP